MPRPSATRWLIATLTVAAFLIGAPLSNANPIPLGSAVWFACTESHYSGPPDLGCPRPYNPLYAQTFLHGFARLTPENEFKMMYLEPSQGSFNFGLADQVASFAKANGKTVRGHTLVWGHQLPGWLVHPFIPWTAQSLTNVLHTYISTVVGHFASAFPGVVTEWDVVNEPLNPDGTLASSVWLRTLGSGYIRDALEFAHAADPAARLVINENGADVPGPKANALLALATALKRAGVPLDAVGFQAHVTPRTAPSFDDLVSLWQRYAAVGLDVEVTEMDVDDDAGIDDPGAKVDVFRRYALACQMVGNCTGFTVWGVADSYSWLGPDSDSLLYDSDFQPTAAGEAVQAILSGHSEPTTSAGPAHRRRRRRPRRRW